MANYPPWAAIYATAGVLSVWFLTYICCWKLFKELEEESVQPSGSPPSTLPRLDQSYRSAPSLPTLANRQIRPTIKEVFKRVVSESSMAMVVVDNSKFKRVRDWVEMSWRLKEGDDVKGKEEREAEEVRRMEEGDVDEAERRRKAKGKEKVVYEDQPSSSYREGFKEE